ncbi:hypothetical protein JMJ58_23965 (plasmid) [Haloterrigena salifodinae]|uniref:Halobacterial output domain-containing protein n=1 Tax=Haloterrigena salifodinae TaxID=2675099 RepID=A0A8T8E8S4_9EURY|nr:HalOD1 output domain-containing protein [Haloterrigena salifodinae]QRV17846.1 hypothetical protein JMJ58_23965 [Haloterrigena salifodinae]
MSSAVDSAADRPTHHLHHDWSGEEWASDRIVQAIAEYENEHPEDLPPLSGSINPEAIDSAFEFTDGNAGKAGCITFSYYGYTVLVQSTGQILIKKS